MNKKQKILTAIAVALLVAVALAGDPKPESQPATGTGRFQLISGQVDRSWDIESLKKLGLPVEQHVVFKIDTVTGKTWIYERLSTSWGGEGWTEITNRAVHFRSDPNLDSRVQQELKRLSEQTNRP